jgi:hypothetical protein
MWQLFDLQISNFALLAFCRTPRECTCVVCVYKLYLAFSVKGSSRHLYLATMYSLQSEIIVGGFWSEEAPILFLMFYFKLH